MRLKEFEIQDVVILVKSHFKSYCIVLSIVFVLSSIKLFTTPNYYTSVVTLAQEASSGFGGEGLSSLASLAGINLSQLGGGSSDAISADIYPDVVSSTPFLQQLLKVKVEGQLIEFSGTLNEFLTRNKPWFDLSSLFKKSVAPSVDVPAYISPQEMSVIKKLNESLSVIIDKKTGVISIEGTFEDPYVAQIVTDSVSNLLQNYIFEYRTKKASLDLKHAKEFMEESKNDYLESSVKYATFADKHINLLSQEYKTQMIFLENEMNTNYQIYSQAAQQVTIANAKLQAQVPVYNVIQPAIIPNKKSGPKRVITIGFFVFLAFAFQTVYFYVREQSIRNAHVDTMNM
ncbi:MAG: chain-length determining protein [Bacteroidales bacterium]|nr:chain-length determining protein [Bacteroidales bacterium]